MGGGENVKRSSVTCLSVDWRLSCPVQTTALRILQPKTHTSGNKPWFQFGGLTLQPKTHTSGNKPWFQFGGLTLQPKTHTSDNKPWFQFGGWHRTLTATENAACKNTHKNRKPLGHANRSWPHGEQRHAQTDSFLMSLCRCSSNHSHQPWETRWWKRWHQQWGKQWHQQWGKRWHQPCHWQGKRWRKEADWLVFLWKVHLKDLKKILNKNPC